MSGSEGSTVVDAIARPSDLRKLHASELEKLAAETREFNLGVVELTHRVVVTAEDGVRRGGVGRAIDTALSELARERGRTSPFVVTLGLPDASRPQDRPDALLSELGPHGPGLAATALAALSAHRVLGRA